MTAGNMKKKSQSVCSNIEYWIIQRKSILYRSFSHMKFSPQNFLKFLSKLILKPLAWFHWSNITKLFKFRLGYIGLNCIVGGRTVKLKNNPKMETLLGHVTEIWEDLLCRDEVGAQPWLVNLPHARHSELADIFALFFEKVLHRHLLGKTKRKEVR